MIRAMLDTNVLASGISGAGKDRRSAPIELWRLWRKGAYQLYYSAEIQVELERALRNPYFRAQVSWVKRERALRSLREEATIAERWILLEPIATHPEDDLILRAAVSADVDFLVTGDIALQKLGIVRRVTIVSPRAFLSVLQDSLADPASDD